MNPNVFTLTLINVIILETDCEMQTVALKISVSSSHILFVVTQASYKELIKTKRIKYFL